MTDLKLFSATLRLRYLWATDKNDALRQLADMMKDKDFAYKWVDIYDEETNDEPWWRPTQQEGLMT